MGGSSFKLPVPPRPETVYIPLSSATCPNKGCRVRRPTLMDARRARRFELTMPPSGPGGIKSLGKKGLRPAHGRIYTPDSPVQIRISGSSMKSSSAALKPPKHLRPDTAAWFTSVVADYDFESHHLKLLIKACESWDRSEQAREALATHGMTYADRFGAPR